MMLTKSVARASTGPSVSVIVLTVNGAKVLERCLQHLYAQTYTNFDIIVVDNGSSDESHLVLKRFLSTGKLSVIRSPYNRGCPGGRNLGFSYATGDLVAFIDNDGYAAPDWLERVVERFQSDKQAGAVASMVFFEQHPLIVNGIGGALNYQGYGVDCGIQQPYEFLDPPKAVAYPMGCGMVIRREVFDRLGPLDEAVANYYDDVEVGIRTWKLGYTVITAPDAWIDHEFNYSSIFVSDKYLLSEKARVRTVLKYYPLRRLLAWGLSEIRLLFSTDGLANLRLRALLWNAWRLPEIVAWRARIHRWPGDFWSIVTPTWGIAHPGLSDNRVFRPDPQRVGARLTLDGQTDGPYLQFGWHPVNWDDGVPYRWTAPSASFLFSIERDCSHMSVEWIPGLHGLQPVRLAVRRVGTVDFVWQAKMGCGTAGWVWQTTTWPCRLSAGRYECLVITPQPFVGAGGWILGCAIRSVLFSE